MREEKKKILSALGKLNACKGGMDRVRASRHQSWQAIWDHHRDWADTLWVLGAVTKTKQERAKIALCLIDLAYTAFSPFLFAEGAPIKYRNLLTTLERFANGKRHSPMTEIRDFHMMDAYVPITPYRIVEFAGDITTWIMRGKGDLYAVFAGRNIVSEIYNLDPRREVSNSFIADHLRSWFPEAPDIFTK